MISKLALEMGLDSSELAEISQIIFATPKVKDAVIFGSRAIGNYKRGSDIDIALFGENLNREEKNRIQAQLNEETLMPYFFDVLHFDTLKNEDLKKHILSFGKSLLTVVTKIRPKK